MSHPVLRFTASRGGALVARGIRALAVTWRYSVDGEEHLRAVRETGRGVVFCFWHGRMLELAPLHADDRVGVLVSTHPDGIMAERIVAPLGYVPIRGSERRRPVAGLRGMVRHAEEGRDLALTPDAHSAGTVLPGAIGLARLTGHVLVPVAAAATPCKQVESWDRFEIPWPGARVRVRYGEPVMVEPDADAADLEGARTKLEEALKILHEELEGELGRAPAGNGAHPVAAAALDRTNGRP